MGPDIVIVARHDLVAQYLIEHDIVDESTPVVSNPSVDQVKGKVVYAAEGELPIRLAARAAAVYEVEINWPMELSRKFGAARLTLDDVRPFTGPVIGYRVDLIDEG